MASVDVEVFFPFGVGPTLNTDGSVANTVVQVSGVAAPGTVDTPILTAARTGGDGSLRIKVTTSQAAGFGTGEFATVFLNIIFIKQKRVRRPPTIDGMDIDEFIRQNADPIWLHQNEMWEDIDTDLPEVLLDGVDFADEEVPDRYYDLRDEDEPYWDDDLTSENEQDCNGGRRGDDEPEDIPF